MVSKRSFIRKTITILFVIFLILLLDQLTKNTLYEFFSDGNDIINITFFLDFVLIWNHGISFGIFNNDGYNQDIFIIIATIIICILIIWTLKEQHHLYAKSLIIGGALGNLLDRIYYGAVIDFIDFHIGQHHYPAFNLADCAIVTGVFWIFFLPTISKKVKNKKAR